MTGSDEVQASEPKPNITHAHLVQTTTGPAGLLRLAFTHANTPGLWTEIKTDLETALKTVLASHGYEL